MRNLCSLANASATITNVNRPLRVFRVHPLMRPRNAAGLRRSQCVYWRISDSTLTKIIPISHWKGTQLGKTPTVAVLKTHCTWFFKYTPLFFLIEGVRLCGVLLEFLSGADDARMCTTTVGTQDLSFYQSKQG